MGSNHNSLGFYELGLSFFFIFEFPIPLPKTPLKLYTKYENLNSFYRDEEGFLMKRNYYYYKGYALDHFSGLDLSCNQLEGPIPEEIGNLSWLLSLNLSNNQLTGPIPRTLSNLIELESLDLSHNLLTGHIPQELGNLQSLEVFSVAYNNLSGALLAIEGQFSTFTNSSYEGNPNLCGPPLTESCSTPETILNIDFHDSRLDVLVLSACVALAYVIGFWAFMAVLYFKKAWRYSLFIVVDEYSDRFFMKIHELRGRMR